MTAKYITQLDLPQEVKTMAKMAAIRLGVPLSKYVATLILEDCKRSGISDLLTPSTENPEVKP